MCRCMSEKKLCYHPRSKVRRNFPEDVLDPDAEKNVNQNVADVVNYVKAVEYALERMETPPLSNRLIRETHTLC